MISNCIEYEWNRKGINYIVLLLLYAPAIDTYVT